MGSLTDIFTKITLSHLDNKGEAKKHDFIDGAI